MIDEKRLQVGFNEDEIRRFLPEMFDNWNCAKHN